MKKPLVEMISRIARGAAPATAIVTSLAAPLAQGASGDLDPAFADVGRLSQIPGLDGAAWSVVALEEGNALFGGGDFKVEYDWFCYYDSDGCDLEASNFAGRLTREGSIDATFAAADVADVEVLGLARQADGKVVAAGRKVTGTSRQFQRQLLVFRLASDGSLDTAFAEDGLFVLPDDYGLVHEAQAVALQPNGRIVVAGVREIASGDAVVSELIVLRLRPDGRLDGSFGNAGVYVGPAVPYGNTIRLARTAAGTYRIAAVTDAGCAVIGLTAAGAPDETFGSAGVAPVESAPGEPVYCESIAAQDDGRLLVAGNAAGHGYAARLLANGARDPAFATDAALADSMNDATSIAVASGGRILVAGSGAKGASIMRLQATGQLDAEFGNGGRTWIDLQSDAGGGALVHDMAVGADGSVIAAGGDVYQDRPFAVRLLGDGGGDSPGVLSFSEPYAVSDEVEGHAVVHVRRSGGSAGDVSIGYQTIGNGQAISGEDFTAASGTLHWADGDVSEREIEIGIAADDGPAEVYESFGLVLSDARGGAGIGTQNATVDIQADGAPSGQITLDYADDDVREGGVANVWVSRNFYAEGQVSVTLTANGGTAEAGEDFDADPVTITWADGETGGKQVVIALPDDSKHEDRETFNVELSDPTGGSILGTSTSHVITIAASDAPSPPPLDRGSGGGGAAGILSLLLLGLAEIFRSARQSLDRRA